MELRWPGAYGQVKKRRRSDGGAAPRSKRLAVDLGSTGIRAGPGGFGISRRPLPLPPWPEPPSTGVSRGRFDHHADHEVVAMAIAPLTDITHVASEPSPAHAALPPGLCCGRFDFDLVADALAPFTDATHVFHVAWYPRPTHAAPRGANYILLCNTPNCPKRLQVLVLDPFDPFGLILQRVSETRPGPPVAWPGFSDPSVAELVGEHALWAALHEGLNCSSWLLGTWVNQLFKLDWAMIGHMYSGSLFMYADHRGGAYSKNSSGNIYAAVGVFVLDPLFREAWGSKPPKMQAKFNYFLEALGGFWKIGENCFIKSALGDILTQFYQKSQILHTYKVKMPSCFLLGAKDLWFSVSNRLQYGRPLKERGVDTRNIFFSEDIHGLDKMVKSPDFFSTSGCQTQYLIVLVLILGFFIPNVKADAGMMCPTQSINDFMPKTPKTTCQVIKLSGVHWSHSKTSRNTFTDGDTKVNDFIEYFLGNNFTKCTMFQDILFVLEFILLCLVLCQLDQHKQVRFFYLDRTVISLWIDTSLGRIVYHACWSLYGSLLSLSKDDEVKHFGLHIHYINLGGCWMSAILLLLLLARHAKDCQFILHRLVGLLCLILPLYYLRLLNPSNDNIFIIGLLGFSAMVPMYVLKWFTIVGFKWPTTVLNIVTILLWLCCVRAETTRSWYGYAQLGSILFRATDVKRSIGFILPSERAGMWASMRATMKGQWRLVAVTMRRTVATVKRKLRPRGVL